MIGLLVNVSRNSFMIFNKKTGASKRVSRVTLNALSELLDEPIVSLNSIEECHAHSKKIKDEYEAK